MLLSIAPASLSSQLLSVGSTSLGFKGTVPGKHRKGDSMLLWYRLEITEVSFFTGSWAPENWGDQVLFLGLKGGSKDFFKLKRGDDLYILKETKYFVKHFRFQRKGLSDATR